VGDMNNGFGKMIRSIELERIVQWFSLRLGWLI
jgi:hypothetical protein